MDGFRVDSPSTGCGSCTACCTHLPIPAHIVGPTSKPAGVACRHVRRSGCAVYARRPQICADFACAWLKADWPAPWRPDRSGLLCLSEQLQTHLSASAVYEIRRGALQTPIAAQIIARLRQATAAVVLISSDRLTRRCLLGRLAVDEAHGQAPAPHYRRSSLPSTVGKMPPLR